MLKDQASIISCAPAFSFSDEGDVFFIRQDLGGLCTKVFHAKNLTFFWSFLWKSSVHFYKVKMLGKIRFHFHFDVFSVLYADSAYC